MNDHRPDGYFTVDELVLECDVHHSTIRSAIVNAQIEPAVIGKKKLYPLARVKEQLARSRAKVGRPKTEWKPETLAAIRKAVEDGLKFPQVFAAAREHQEVTSASVTTKIREMKCLIAAGE